jgi:hypothetical protein
MRYVATEGIFRAVAASIFIVLAPEQSNGRYYSPMKTLMRRGCLIALAFAIFACSAQNGGGALQTGMTNDQAVAAMGQPDLKDAVPDPNHAGAQLYRYSWLSAGQAGVFGPDNHLVSVQNITSSTVTPAEEAAAQQPTYFDPIQTPLDYAFYPFRAAFVYIAAGLNCVGGAGCNRPKLPPVTQG